jgi:bifunctional lysine-specific demethylase and histidyl-hydroxylase NO66
LLVVDSALRLADWGADEMGKQFLWDRLPPAYSEEEKADTSDGQPGAPIFPETMVRISRDGIARVVVEGDKAVVYHCGDNDRKYHSNPLSPLDFELDDAPTIECLFKTVAPR